MDRLVWVGSYLLRAREDLTLAVPSLVVLALTEGGFDIEDLTLAADTDEERLDVAVGTDGAGAAATGEPVTLEIAS